MYSVGMNLFDQFHMIIYNKNCFMLSAKFLYLESRIFKRLPIRIFHA